jgi:hypothetical protein
METTEGGVLFDHRDGTLTFHNRAHRLTEAAVFTLDMAQHMVESDYQPKMDRTTMANDITAAGRQRPVHRVCVRRAEPQHRPRGGHREH